MPASNIKVFLRVRPCMRPSPAFRPDVDRGAVSFELERAGPEYEVNHQKLNHDFRFDGILPMTVTQQDVLNAVAKPVIEDVLNGVNGTIFAYGQTGSGKTFTITGGAARYEDRGLIPRTISYMFERFRQADAQYKMYISYLEIYQDTGYDLLREDSAQKLEDLPKVQLREDEDGHFHLRNLSVNTATSEEDALNLLFLGDTNRIVAETPMNDASTRSHCLFIIWVESTPPGSDVVRRSKLHLVDLAGSERVSRTGVEGKLLAEAKAINLSLHYLERVIVALHARSKGEKGHVPYRDSMMTSVLRDSLGGNCRTTMVACMAVEPANIDESISTCRFAQRVAQIKNDAKVNEELDPSLLIARLKREVSELKQEVSVARGGEGAEGEGDELSPEDVEQCRALVLQFVSRNADPKEPFICGSVARLRTSFRLLRDLCNGARAGGGGGGGRAASDPAARAALEAEAAKLRLEIAQRDQEIGVMVQMLSKRKAGAGDSRPFIEASSSLGGSTALPPDLGNAIAAAATAAFGQQQQQQQQSLQQQQQQCTAGAAAPQEAHAAEEVAPAAPAAKPRPAPRIPGQKRAEALPMPSSVDAALLLLDQQKAFDVFRQTVYKPPPSFEENKNLLKDKIAQAKAIGDDANAARFQINQAKSRLERLRTERAMTAADQDGVTELEDGPEELAEVHEIDRLKAAYRDSTAELRRVKGEVEMIQRLLEQNRTKMQKEFEAWFGALRKQAEVSKLDEDTKRELYEKVVGGGSSAPVTPAAAALPQATAFAATPRSVPAAAAARDRAKATGHTRTDDDIAKYYAALGELAKRG